MAEANIDMEDGSEEETDKEHNRDHLAVTGEGPSQKSSSKNRDPFLTETKYVVLNFMSLVPPDLYHNHLSSSPESAISDLSVGDSYNKHFHPLGNQHKAQHLLTKSRSFDVPLGRRVPQLKHLSHLSSLQDPESPASEDNLNYRYRQYLHELEQHSIPENSTCSPEINHTPEPCDQDLSGIKSQSAMSLKSGSPGSVSPRKTPHSLSRWYSDISSSGDFSYDSDADDELEDLSNASSQLSNRSAHLRGGFLDLRKPSPRLSTVTSQSEMELDDVDGLFSSVDGMFHAIPTVAQEQTKHDANAENVVIDDNYDQNDTQNTDIIAGTNNEPGSTKTPSPRQGSPYKKQHSKDSIRSHAQYHHLWSHDQHGSHDQHLHHHHNHPIPGSSQDMDGVDNDERRGVADRSKLKLDIPTQIVQLDDILVSLQTDLNSEMTDLESEFEEALRSSSNASGRRHTNIPTPLTPQSEAARILARIGDEVSHQYGSQITAAVNEVMLHKLKELTYRQFKEIAKAVIDENLPGWRQVALLMVFGQKMVWKSLEKGQKQFGGLVDLSAQLVADVAADFIIREGGWGAVMNFDPSQSSDSQSSAVEDKSPSILDFFSSHNVTQVESGDLKDNSAEIDSSSSGTNVDTGQNSKGKVVSHLDGSGEPIEQGTDNGTELNNVGGDDINEIESMDGVFDENTNQNAQSEDHVEERNRLSLSSSGRDLIPSLGFEYIAGNEPQSGRSDMSSAGFQFSQTDYMHKVFDYDLSEASQKMNIVEENEENRKQNQDIPKPTTEVKLDSNTVTTEEATSANKQNTEDSGIETGIETESGQVARDELINSATNSSTSNVTDDDIDNHNTHDNQTVPDRTKEDTANIDDNTTKDSEDSGLHSESGSGEDSQWYTAYRRLGYGAVGMSLGVLALGLAIRQMR